MRPQVGVQGRGEGKAEFMRPEVGVHARGEGKVVKLRLCEVMSGDIRPCLSRIFTPNPNPNPNTNPNPNPNPNPSDDIRPRLSHADPMKLDALDRPLASLL